MQYNVAGIHLTQDLTPTDWHTKSMFWGLSVSIQNNILSVSVLRKLQCSIKADTPHIVLFTFLSDNPRYSRPICCISVTKTISKQWMNRSAKQNMVNLPRFRICYSSLLIHSTCFSVADIDVMWWILLT